jgi:pimeloyl-ACP methyl ester carboxylesterase
MIAAYVASQPGDQLVGVFLEDAPIFTLDDSMQGESSLVEVFADLQAMLEQHHETGKGVRDLEADLGRRPIPTGPYAGQTHLDVWGDIDVPTWARQLHRLDPSLIGALFTNLSDGFDPTKELCEIDCPVHFITGDPAVGGLVTEEEIRQLSALIPDMTHSHREGAGHSIKIGDPDWYLRELDRFLTRV